MNRTLRWRCEECGAPASASGKQGKSAPDRCGVCGSAKWREEHGAAPHASRQPYRRGERLFYTSLSGKTDRIAVYDRQLANGRFRVAYMRDGKPALTVVAAEGVRARRKAEPVDEA